jgi:E3 ubiquitin-protein ligase RNF14
MEKCGHIFRIECLQASYNGDIKAGNVTNIKCLAYNCGTENDDARTRRGKKQSLISPRELLQIPLERDVVQRYVDIKRKKLLEADHTTIFCPRKWCQGASNDSNYPKSTVPLEEMNESDTEDANPVIPPKQSLPAVTLDRNHTQEEQLEQLKQLYGKPLHIYEDCEFAFCKLCHASWHEEHVWCFKERIEAEVNAEEMASLDFIRATTTACPTCTSPISKIEACNHMTCGQCRSHFCYLCSQSIDPSGTYEHFGWKGTSCYMKLFAMPRGESTLQTRPEDDENFIGARRIAREQQEEEEAERQRREQQQREDAERQIAERRAEFEACMGSLFLSPH